jgi:hypothetical protein
MDAEITMDWMGEVLKALARWFMPPKDLSDLPDAPPRLAFDGGVGGVGVWGAVGGTGGGGGFGNPIIAPYVQLQTIPAYGQFPTFAPFVQPVYETETIGAGGVVREAILTTGEYTFDTTDGTFDDTGVLNNG